MRCGGRPSGQQVRSPGAEAWGRSQTQGLGARSGHLRSGDGPSCSQDRASRSAVQRARLTVARLRAGVGLQPHRRPPTRPRCRSHREPEGPSVSRERLVPPATEDAWRPSRDPGRSHVAVMRTRSVCTGHKPFGEGNGFTASVAQLGATQMITGTRSRGD